MLEMLDYNQVNAFYILKIKEIETKSSDLKCWSRLEFFFFFFEIRKNRSGNEIEIGDGQSLDDCK